LAQVRTPSSLNFFWPFYTFFAAMRFMIVLYVTGFLLFGCMNTLTTKIMFTHMSEGIDGEAKAFKKPWFAVWAMFVGMAFNLIAHVIFEWKERRNGTLVDSDAPKGDLTPLTRFLWVGVPAMFDLTTTGLSSIGLLYIPASVWQMLRGANIIFSAMFSVLFLDRKMRTFNWLGIAIVVIGIFLVGLANHLSTASSGDAEGVDLAKGGVMFGMGMTVVAQLFSGGQVVTEEKLMKGLNVPKLQLVGYEGVWGTVVLLLLFPLMYYAPGNDAGSFENGVDTIEMVENSNTLRNAVLTYTFSCMCYNLCAVCVTGALSAVHRTMFMALRTLIVWIVDLTVHYVIDPSSPWGEAWSPYSYLELVGFVVLVTGQFIYAGILQVPGLRYAPSPPNSPPAAQNFSSPGGMKMDSPCLPDVPDEIMDMDADVKGDFKLMTDDKIQK